MISDFRFQHLSVSAVGLLCRAFQYVSISVCQLLLADFRVSAFEMGP
jgi:hypothetical protein